jgi:outer membrane protein OmpA-like peptidoglycan-associated protein
MSQIPQIPLTARFSDVFVFPRKQIEDPGNNVVIAARLFNFDVAKAVLRPGHSVFLRQVAVTILRPRTATGAVVTGIASTTGQDAFNLRLSRLRAHNVAQDLGLFLVFNNITDPPKPPPRIRVLAQGEHYAQAQGEADGHENAQFRAVLVTVLADRTKSSRVRLHEIL